MEAAGAAGGGKATVGSPEVDAGVETAGSAGEDAGAGDGGAAAAGVATAGVSGVAGVATTGETEPACAVGVTDGNSVPDSSGVGAIVFNTS